jgi:hypothetical protein
VGHAEIEAAAKRSDCRGEQTPFDGAFLQSAKLYAVSR